MTKIHQALLYISTDVVGGVARCQKYLSRLQDHLRTEAISSIYKRYLNSDHVDMKAQMEFAIRVQTSLEPEPLLLFATNLDPKVEMTLLAFDTLILMSPAMTLPYPNLHTDGLVIRAAAEAWGSYAHPIYEKTLGEISKGARPVNEAEFFLQGRSLIDIE